MFYKGFLCFGKNKNVKDLLKTIIRRAEVVAMGAEGYYRPIGLFQPILCIWGQMDQNLNPELKEQSRKT